MYDRSKESRGAMFPRNKTSQNAPDMGGEFEITGDLLAYIKSELQRGAVSIKIYGSAWRQQSQKGLYQSISLRPPREAQEGGYQTSRNNAPQSTGNQRTLTNSYGDQSGFSDRRYNNNVEPIRQAPPDRPGSQNYGQRLQHQRDAFDANRHNPSRGIDPSLNFPDDNELNDEIPF